MNLQVIIPPGVKALTVNGLCQWDYGRKLEIHAENLPALAEVHFACPGMAEAVVRICDNSEGVIEAVIPDACLEQTAPISAWVFAIDGEEGYTAKTLTLNVEPRTKPQPGAVVPTECQAQYESTLEALNEAYKKEEPAEEAGHAVEADRARTADLATEAERAQTADRTTDANHAFKVNHALRASRAATADMVGTTTNAAVTKWAARATLADVAMSAESAAVADTSKILDGFDGSFMLTWGDVGFFSEEGFTLEEGLYIIYLQRVGSPSSVSPQRIELYSQPFVVHIHPEALESKHLNYDATEVPVVYKDKIYYGRMRISKAASYSGARIRVFFRDLYNIYGEESRVFQYEDIGCEDGWKIEAYYKKIMSS